MSPSVGSPAPTADRRLDEGRQTPAAGAQIARRGLVDQPPALVGVRRREELLERDVDEIRVAVEGLPVRVRELRALDDRVDELGRGQVREVEAGEQRELLEQHRALAPRPGLADGVAAVLERGRRLERRAPRGEVAAVEQAAVLAAEAVDRVCDEALVEDVPRALDLGLAVAAQRLGHDPAVRRRQLPVPEQLARLRRRQVQLRRPRPVPQERLGPADRRRDARDDRIAVLGVADRELEHVGEAHRPEVAQEQHPAVERAGDARGEQPGAGDEVVAELPVALDRGGGGRDALCAERRADGPAPRSRGRRAGRRPGRSGAARPPAR